MFFGNSTSAEKSIYIDDTNPQLNSSNYDEEIFTDINSNVFYNKKQLIKAFKHSTLVGVSKLMYMTINKEGEDSSSEAKCYIRSYSDFNNDNCQLSKGNGLIGLYYDISKPYEIFYYLETGSYVIQTF